MRYGGKLLIDLSKVLSALADAQAAVGEINGDVLRVIANKGQGLELDGAEMAALSRFREIGSWPLTGTQAAAVGKGEEELEGDLAFDDPPRWRYFLNEAEEKIVGQYREFGCVPGSVDGHDLEPIEVELIRELRNRGAGYKLEFGPVRLAEESCYGSLGYPGAAISLSITTAAKAAPPEPHPSGIDDPAAVLEDVVEFPPEPVSAPTHDLDIPEY